MMGREQVQDTHAVRCGMFAVKFHWNVLTPLGCSNATDRCARRKSGAGVVFSASSPQIDNMMPLVIDMKDELEALVTAEHQRVSVAICSSGGKQKRSTINSYWLVFCACVIGWGMILLFVMGFTRHVPMVAVVAVDHFHTALWPKQDRPVQQLGRHEDGYVEINTDRSTVAKRIQDLRELDQVRFGPCGRFEEFLAGETTTNWRENSHRSEKLKVVHCRDSEAYRVDNCCRKEQELKRYICEAEHPRMKAVTVTMERYGKFSGHGGYDWSAVRNLEDVGGLQNRMNGKSVAFVGGMAAPIYANGTIIGYPPLHIHHAHILPYADKDERQEKIHGSFADHHDILHQSHGDTECHAEEGGLACLLTVLDPGMVRVVANATSGLRANFEVNDVRPMGSNPFDYWFENVVMFAPYERNSMQRSTHIGINNQCIGKGPCTYPIPYDPNTNLLAYTYTHGEFGSDLSSGYISNFILHTHQTIMDSAFLFISPDDTVFQTIDSFRQGRDYPLILDCLHNESVQLYDLEGAKQELFGRIFDAGGKLVCEATRPSVQMETDASSTNITHWYDRRARLNCQRDPVPLQVGDVLTVLAFNEIRPHNVTRSEACEFRRTSPFEESFAVQQHSIFRFDLSHDADREPEYVPPSYFFYALRGRVKKRKHEPLDSYMNTGCPADSIRYGF